MRSAPDRGHLLFRVAMRACSQKRTGITNDGTTVPALLILLDAPRHVISEFRGAGVANPALSALRQKSKFPLLVPFLYSCNSFSIR
jgi:hypothetical protein